jgi:hypothetical protein
VFDTIKVLGKKYSKATSTDNSEYSIEVEPKENIIVIYFENHFFELTILFCFNFRYLNFHLAYI